MLVVVHMGLAIAASAAAVGAWSAFGIRLSTSARREPGRGRVGNTVVPMVPPRAPRKPSTALASDAAETSAGEELDSAASDDREAPDEHVIDTEALLERLAASGGQDSIVLEDMGDEDTEPWEAMVERIHFEGGTPTASDFRAPSPMPSPYEARQGFREINAGAVQVALETDSTTELWDVRDAEEYALGHMPGAMSVPFDVLSEAAARIVAAEEAGSAPRVLLVSATGRRSGQAQVRLTQVHGLQDVMTVRGGLASWEAGGGDLVG